MTNPTVMNDQKPHFVLVPLMAQGHTIPMIDMAQLFAQRGVVVSVITTPLNASRIKTVIDRVKESGLPVRFVPLRFPCAEAGLPEGCENLDTLPSRDLMTNFLDATAMLREPLVQHLRSQKPAPSCIVSAYGHPWTRQVALEFGIPRFVFHGFGCFSLLSIYNIRHYKVLENITDEPFVLRGMPHRIEMTRAQVPAFFNMPGIEKYREEMSEAELAADGVLVNSFHDLEPTYFEYYQKAIGKKAWTIGPLSLFNRDIADMAARGNKASIDQERCLSWLDSMKPRSVVYVSFGSMALTTPSQLFEIGLGLEASEHPFIWVIKAGDKSSEVEEWLAGGFQERIKERGLVIRGWAPQVMILSHPAVSAFVTHCGWNSTLEAVSTGVPMITWPHFAEQFLNEKLIVEILRIGIAVGVKDPTKWGMENLDVLAKKDDVNKAVRRLMDEGEEIRERATEFGEKARKAMEIGGSSYENMTHLIQYVLEHGKKNIEGTVL